MAQQASLPKHIQISELLIREIAAGRLQDGERLPPERQMAGTLGIAVGTLRRALATLHDKGLLRRVQGSGNYVCGAGDLGGVYAMFRLERPDGGGLPTADVLDVATSDKPVGLPDFGASDRATRIRRLRRLDQQPVAVEEIWLDASVGRLRADLLSESLYRSYQKQLGLWILRAEDRVAIGKTPDWAPAPLGLAPGAASGFVERLSWGDAPAPVEYSRTWFNPARAVYVQRLG